MKTILAILILFSSLLNLNILKAQTISNMAEVTFNADKIKKWEYFERFFYDANSNIYSLKSDGNLDDFINFYDENWNITKSQPISLTFGEGKKNENFLEGGFAINKKLHIFKSTSFDKENKHVLSYTKIENQVESEPIELITKVAEQDWFMEHKHFVLFQSPNRNFLAVKYTNDYKKQKEKNNSVIVVYDSLMNKVFETTVSSLFEEGPLMREEFHVTNNAEVLIKYTLKLKTGHANYVAVFKKDSEPVHIPIKYGSYNRMSEMILAPVDNKKILIAAMYYEKENLVPSGMFSMFLDLEKLTTSEGTTSKFNFTLAEEADVKGHFANKSQRLGIYCLRPVFHSDKSVSFLFEQAIKMVVNEQTERGGDIYKFDVTHFFNFDVIIGRVDSETGKFLWTNSSKKKQYSMRDDEVSVFATHKNDNLCLIFNDNAKNAINYDPNNLELMNEKCDRSIIIEEYDKDGKMTRDVLVKKEENKEMSIYPKFSFNMGKDENHIYIFDELNGPSVKLKIKE